MNQIRLLRFYKYLSTKVLKPAEVWLTLREVLGELKSLFRGFDQRLEFKRLKLEGRP